MGKITKKSKLNSSECIAVVGLLNELYPEAKAELDFTNPYELLVATVLSAQCTDIRVNIVTKALFKIAPDPESLYALPLPRLEETIKTCGLYKSKAKNLHETARILLEEFNGNIPDTIDTLVTLPGVGRKTANVVVSNAFNIPAIAVDTHVFRVSNRIGLANANTVEETEQQLMKVVPRDQWTKTHHTIIFHGRRQCKARKPECSTCAIKVYCLFYKKEEAAQFKGV